MDVKNLDEFKKMVASGLIKDKYYFYKRTEEIKQAQTENVPFLIELFKREFGVPLFPIYGTLLGIIRDNDYILHDNDIDLSYVSNYSNNEQIVAEWHSICSKLDSLGYLAKKCTTKGQLHCYGKNKEFKYDIWTSFIYNHNLSIVPLIDKNIKDVDLFPLKEYIFRNIPIQIPNNPKKILSVIYKTWETAVFPFDKNQGTRKKWKKLL